MTEKAHRRHKIERIKERLALAFVLILSTALWLAIGWMCWIVSKAPL
jgi:hypothetical protein